VSDRGRCAVACHRCAMRAARSSVRWSSWKITIGGGRLP